MLIFNKNVSVNFYVMIKVLEVFTDRVENIFFLKMRIAYFLAQKIK